MRGEQDVRWEDGGHFVGIAARAMRQILLDRARTRGADQRQMFRADRRLSHIVGPSSGQDLDVPSLHEALDESAAYTRDRPKSWSCATSAD